MLLSCPGRRAWRAERDLPGRGGTSQKPADLTVVAGYRPPAGGLRPRGARPYRSRKRAFDGELTVKDHFMAAKRLGRTECSSTRSDIPPASAGHGCRSVNRDDHSPAVQGGRNNTRRRGGRHRALATRASAGRRDKPHIHHQWSLMPRRSTLFPYSSWRASSDSLPRADQGAGQGRSRARAAASRRHRGTRTSHKE